MSIQKVEKKPLMPKATAVWLIENTALSFKQIADFCELHLFEIEEIANMENTVQITGVDPIQMGHATLEDIKLCEQDCMRKLSFKPIMTIESVLGKKKTKYTPIAKRKEKPHAIAWFLKYCPQLTDTQICRLIGTTKSLIESIRSKTHWDYQNIRPKHPIQVGLCEPKDLELEIEMINKIIDTETNSES